MSDLVRNATIFSYVSDLDGYNHNRHGLEIIKLFFMSKSVLIKTENIWKFWVLITQTCIYPANKMLQCQQLLSAG